MYKMSMKKLCRLPNVQTAQPQWPLVRYSSWKSVAVVNDKCIYRYFLKIVDTKFYSDSRSTYR